jgi:Putative Flp pilus-assembly TadE/G-like
MAASRRSPHVDDRGERQTMERPMNSVIRDRVNRMPTRARAFSRRTRQGGQAILWFLATAAACCAVLALVYNVGQVTNEKEKTINAADAAALSGALVEARMLNFMAYTNRAMIANEVTIAQIISFDSWVRYDNQLVQTASYIPIVGGFIEATLGTVTQAAVAAMPVFEEMIPVIDTFVNTALVGVRDVANGAAVAAARDVATQIAQANQTAMVNDNGVDAAAFALNEQAWLSFTKVYSGDDRGNAAQVVLDSRDQFSTHRGLGTAFNLLNDNPVAATGVDKTSGDTKLRNYDHWEAEDSADLWVGLQVLGITVAKLDTLPVGWGRVDTNKNGDTGEDWDFGNGPCTQWIALGCEFAYASDNPVSGWSGIPGIRDLANPGSKSNDPSLTYIVAVKKSAQANLTTQHIGSGMNNVRVSGPQGSPDLKDNLLGNRDELASISAARVFFARPFDKADKTAGKLLRSDGAQEYASLYNPYWQARLTNPDTVTIEGVSAKSLLYTALGQAEVAAVLNCATNPASCP